MIDHLPLWLNISFIVIVIATIVLFHYSNGKPKLITSLIVLWSFAHSVLAYFGFYQDMKAIPPRFALVLVPALAFIFISLLPKFRNRIIETRNTRISTFLHIIRLPVELVLFQLFLHKMIPELMTFEGRNFDIIAGITAPIVGLLYLKNKLSRKALFAWNAVMLGFIAFILINGILSAELPFQQFAFDQPNRAVIYFPFILLPATVVPIVIWTHLVDILKLMKNKQ